MLDVVDEGSLGDMFSQVVHELNIEVNLDTPSTLEHQRDKPSP
jgi:hypothetical protein